MAKQPGVRTWVRRWILGRPGVVEALDRGEDLWQRALECLKRGERVVVHVGHVELDANGVCCGGPGWHESCELMGWVPAQHGILTRAASLELQREGEGPTVLAPVFDTVWSAGAGMVLDSNGAVCSPRTPLQARLGPLLGRDAELGAAHAQLCSERLLVLGGPPGIGKSSLARHLARRLFSEDRVWHIWWMSAPIVGSWREAMADVSHVESVEVPREPSLFVVEGAHWSSDSLRVCRALLAENPCVSVMVLAETWEEVLWVQELEGLDGDAGVLWVDACLRQRGGYIRESELVSVRAWVEGVAGHPWALQCYASDLIRGIPVRELQGNTTRHVADALLSQRWNALESGAQAVLCALCVSRGADWALLQELVEGLTPESLDALVVQHLSVASPGQHKAVVDVQEERRWDVRGVTRAFVERRASSTMSALREQHARYFLEKSAGLGVLLETPDEARMYVDFEADHANYEQALRWFEVHDAVSHAQMQLHLFSARHATRRYRDVQDDLERARAALSAEEGNGLLCLRLDFRIATLQRAVGHHAVGCALAMQVLEVVDESSEECLQALTLITGPPQVLEDERFFELLNRGLALARALDRPFWEAKLLFHRATSHHYVAERAQTLERLAMVAQRSQNPSTLGTMELAHALVKLTENALEPARQHFEACYRHWLPLRHNRHLALVTTNLGHTCLQLHDLEAARAWLDIAESRSLRMASDRFLGLVLCNQTMLRVRSGEGWERVLETARRSVDALRGDHPRLGTHARCTLAAVELCCAQPKSADATMVLTNTEEIPPPVLVALDIAREALKSEPPHLASRTLMRLRKKLEALENDVPYDTLRSVRVVILRRIRELEEMHSASESWVLRVARDGGWFEIAGTRVDLRGRAAQRRIVAALVRARDEKRTLSNEEVFACGWPEDSADHKSARARVYVAISTLRKSGLGGVVMRDRTGYWLDREVPIEVEDAHL